MELPNNVRKPIAMNPGTLLIYAPPKTGKTTIVAQLKNSLLLELESRGADYVEGCILDIEKPSDFDAALEAIEKAGKPYDYVIIDTLTKLDEWSEIVGTYNYMQKSQGKAFNREGGKSTGDMIIHTDKRFETVHELGQGFGYQHSRNQMMEWFKKASTVAKHVIFIAHIKDKLVESKSGDAVETSDINLTGKVKGMVSAKVDAIAYLQRVDKQCFLNFDNEYKVVSGGRCNHLQGKILISEKQENGSIKTFWDSVYLKN